ncbi:MAG TPA: flagellar biosynthetic protein FliO [Phycisphaerales bacterium]|nr:flagellar biosynthetic protein FliO [Phycisphaerales bacterium]
MPRVRATCTVVLAVCTAICAYAQDIGPPAPAASHVESPADHTAATPDQSAATERLALGPATPTIAAESRESVALGAGEPRADAGWTRTIVALAGVLAVILAAGVALRRFARSGPTLAVALGPGGPSPSGVLEVLGRYPAGRGQSLVLLKVDRRVLLLSQSHAARAGGGGFRTLCAFDDAEDVASLLVKTRDAADESMSARFTSMLRRFDATHVDGDAGVSWPAPGERADQSAIEGLRRRVAELRSTGLGDAR